MDTSLLQIAWLNVEKIILSLFDILYLRYKITIIW